MLLRNSQTIPVIVIVIMIAAKIGLRLLSEPRDVNVVCEEHSIELLTALRTLVKEARVNNYNHELLLVYN